MINSIKKSLIHFDFFLFLLVISITIFGIIVIGSATKINIYGTSNEYMNQMFWFILGIVLLFLSAFIDYRFLCKFYVFIYFLNLALLIIVLLIGKGNGVSRWLFGIQPSEFAKVFMILFLATFIDKNKSEINNFKFLILLFISTLVPVILIKAQPSLSASLVILSILIFLLFVGKIAYKYITKVLLIIIPVVSFFIYDLLREDHLIIDKILKSYQIERILSAINLDLTGNDASYYQTKNSIWAIGSGQLNGKGLYNGTINQLNFLPESHNDFIFAVIGEEFGFIGCIGVLAVIFIIITKCLIIAHKSSDNLGTLIASGVAGMLFFQTFINVGVATGLIPNTGMPFPFLSYGGSAMCVNMITIGLVLNVEMRKAKTLFER